MLNQITIRNFAIIELLTLDFESGMTVLTGETGAGKSILVDALDLVLGGRAESHWVREGANRAEVSATFDIAEIPLAMQWLKDQDLWDDEPLCYLRRVIQSDGRSKAYIHGRAMPLQSVRELGSYLVEIHGQHENQSLLDRAIQRLRLDAYGRCSLHRQKLGDLCQNYRRFAKEHDLLAQRLEQASNQQTLLRYQVDELERVHFTEEEVNTLAQEHTRLSHLGRLLEESQQSLESLYEYPDGSIYSQLSAIQDRLGALQPFDQRLGEIAAELESAMIHIDEASRHLRDYLKSLNLDPDRLAWVEQRLTTLHDLSRKHRCPLESLPSLLEELRQQLGQLEHGEEDLAHLTEQMVIAQKAYHQVAAELSDQRHKAAHQLSAAVSQLLPGLGMVGGAFAVEVQSEPDQSPHEMGYDQVEFFVRGGTGQSLRPLRKVASGGELSRLALAIQVSTVASLPTQTLIFDEVDAGIGGGVAELVGRHLRALGQDRQVLCVTHLPQVAAQAHHHWRVRKEVEAEKSRTSIQPLTGENRTFEIARMLGGVEMTPQSLAHAQEMLSCAAAQPE